MTAPTRLKDRKIGMLIGFQISLKIDGVAQDYDVSLVSAGFRHTRNGYLGTGTVTKLSAGVYQVTYSTTGLPPGDVFFDVKFNTNPLVVTPTMVALLVEPETH